jgi:hypothetical protein
MANGNSELADKRLIQEDHIKKPYTEPAFRFEQVFETQALSCGKTVPPKRSADLTAKFPSFPAGLQTRHQTKPEPHPGRNLRAVMATVRKSVLIHGHMSFTRSSNRCTCTRISSAPTVWL